MFLVKLNAYRRVIAYRSGFKHDVSQEEEFIDGSAFLTPSDLREFFKVPFLFEYKDGRMTRLYHVNED